MTRALTRTTDMNKSRRIDDGFELELDVRSRRPSHRRARVKERSGRDTAAKGDSAPTAVVRSSAWWRSRVGQPLNGGRTGHARSVGGRESGGREHDGQGLPRRGRVVL